MCDVKPFTHISTPRGDFHSLHSVTISHLWESKLNNHQNLSNYRKLYSVVVLHVVESCI